MSGLQLKEGCEMMRLREHQQALHNYLKEVGEADLPLDLLVDVVPGGGKSKLPGLIAEAFPKHKIAWFVPRLSLARQAAEGIRDDFAIEIRESGNDVNPRRGNRGFVATHAALMADPYLWKDELATGNYILVIDELHHAKYCRKGERKSLSDAISLLPYSIRLCMTGTLDTNDNSLIYNVPYETTDRGYIVNLNGFDGQVIRYNRTTALQEKAIVSVEFHYHDGPVKWENKNGIQENRLSDVSPENESQAIMTAIRTELADQLLDNCVAHWGRCGDKLLVVTADQQSAKKYYARVKEHGVKTGLAISDAEYAHSDIEAFRKGRLDCLVTCQMAYEGLDVPEITHIACLTHIRSTPWILQMLARAWRASPGKSVCWAFVPNDPRMNRVIEKIKAEQEEVIPFAKEITTTPEKSPAGAFAAISGEVQSVKAELMDGEKAVDECESKVALMCEEYGIPIDSPVVAQFLAALRTGATGFTKRQLTVKDKETQTRKEIDRMCKTADFEKKCDYGTHARKLFGKTKKSIADMTLQELERARSAATHICS